MPANPLLTQIFEAYPAPTYLVDEDVVVQLANRAGRALAATEESEPLRRGGDLLRCVHATEHPDGCGRADACEECVVRGSVRDALRTGAVARAPAVVELRGPGGAPLRLTVLVSASPLAMGDARLAVLTIEDVTEFELRAPAARKAAEGVPGPVVP